MTFVSGVRQSVFRTWFRLSRPMTLGVRGLIENPDGEVLLLRHTYVSGWFFPGGGVERGEPAHQALARELVEEAGIVLGQPADLIGIYSNHRVFRNDHVLFYRAAEWTPTEATSRGEIAEIRWCQPSDPPDGTTPGTLRRLAEVYGSAARSDYW